MSKSKILKDIATEKISLKGALMRTLLIASNLDNEKLKKWILNELYGYKEDDIIPHYRKIKGNLKMNYRTMGKVVANEIITTELLPKECSNADVYECFGGIDSIEEVASSKESVYIYLPELKEYINDIKKNDNYKFVVQNLYLSLSNVSFKHILDYVARELFEILLRLDNEFSNLDDLDIVTTPEQQIKVNEFINIKIDSFTNIGNNNEIIESAIAGKGITRDEEK